MTQLTPEQRLIGFQQEFMALQEKYGVTIISYRADIEHQNGQTEKVSGWNFAIVDGWQPPVETEVAPQNGKPSVPATEEAR